MSELRPFAALRFARDPAPRLAPPYDVVSAVDRERYGAEPENVVHLTLPPGAEGERDYASAAATLARWIAEGVLVRDPGERLYVLHERLASGAIRRGVFGLLRLEDYTARVVLPHERTMAGPKRDRLLLTRATGASLEPLFFLYEDRDGETASILESTQEEALAECSGPDGTGLRLCGLDDPERVGSLADFLASRSVVIADGHHRYETMLAYRDECRARAGGGVDPEARSEYVLAYLVNAFDPGTEIRAIHRVLEGEVAEPGPVFEKCGFELEPLGERSADELIELLATRRESEHAFVLARPSGSPLLARRPRAPSDLDVELLHRDVLPALGGELRFDSRPERLLATVRAGEAALGILQNPLRAAELFAVVEQGRVLPQKSTFFAPKVPSGLLIAAS